MALTEKQSAKQRKAALQKANKIRISRARMKERFKSDPYWPIEILSEPPNYVQGMTIENFLLSIPRYGRDRVQILLARCWIRPYRTVGELTSRQRAVIRREIVMKSKEADTDGRT